MKISFVFFFVVFFAAASCDMNRKQERKDEIARIVPVDSFVTKLQEKSGLGDLTIRSFEGTVARGAHCNFIIYQYRNSGDGVFSISIFNAEKELSLAKGVVYTLKGENDSTVWQCVSADGKQTFYFLLDPESDRIFWERSDVDFGLNMPLYPISARIVK